MLVRVIYITATSCLHCGWPINIVVVYAICMLSSCDLCKGLVRRWMMYMQLFSFSHKSRM
jgi:hypothetical protein